MTKRAQKETPRPKSSLIILPHQLNVAKSTKRMQQGKYAEVEGVQVKSSFRKIRKMTLMEEYLFFARPEKLRSS